MAAVDVGERMFLWCHGGPSVGRAEHVPPPAEVELVGGTDVLVDDGPPEQWSYGLVPGGC